MSINCLHSTLYLSLFIDQCFMNGAYTAAGKATHFVLCGLLYQEPITREGASN